MGATSDFLALERKARLASERSGEVFRVTKITRNRGSLISR